MKNPKFHILILFTILCFKLNAGCCLKINLLKLNDPLGNAIGFSSGTATFMTLSYNSSDTLAVWAYACACSASITKIFFNDSLIPLTSKLPCKPGKYRIWAGGLSVGGMMCEFVIVPKIVSVAENKLNSSEISIHPNPSHETVFISSGSLEIKQIRVFNFGSQLIETVLVQGNNAFLCLTNYTPGLYYIEVRTITNKVIIKKLMVQ